MPKVYVVQEPLKRNQATGRMEPFMNIAKAAVYGDLEVVLGPHLSVLSTAPTIHELRLKLESITRDDYLVLIGDTVAIGLATAIALDNTGGVLNILKWNRDSKSYIKLKVEV